MGQAREALLSFQMFDFLETQLLVEGPVEDTPDFRIEPVTAGWAAQMVPLCYAPTSPHSLIIKHTMLLYFYR